MYVEKTLIYSEGHFSTERANLFFIEQQILGHIIVNKKFENCSKIKCYTFFVKMHTTSFF